MTDFIPLEKVEEESLRQALFIDIIRLAPEGAELVITTDSWEDLPSVFGELMNVKKGEWVVILTQSAREFLVQ
jgi:hypothetical protein